ncbi:MAG: phosphoribosylglycinamide formyltransferase [Oscillospiraceae bacterium]|nr:phosphoribosylglycinamide formyltransferase [Oscillospiraceae bacterium]
MPRQVKTAVMVSGSGSGLQSLIDAGKRGETPHVALSLVVSSKPESYALVRAERNGIGVAVVERKKYGADIAGFESELLPHLRAEKIEFIILAGFLTVFSKDFIDKFADRIINVHPALIPSFCGKGFYGLRVHRAAIEYGVKVSGATVHYVNETVDGGRILLQKAVEVLDEDTPESLQSRIMSEAEWELLPKAAEIVAKRIAKETDAEFREFAQRE